MMNRSRRIHDSGIWKCYEQLEKVAELDNGLLLDGYWDFNHDGFYLILYTDGRLVRFLDKSENIRVSFLGAIEGDGVRQVKRLDTLSGEVVVRSDVIPSEVWGRSFNIPVSGQIIGSRIAREQKYYHDKQIIPGGHYSIKNGEIQSVHAKLSRDELNDISSRLLGEYDDIIELAKENLPLFNSPVVNMKRVAFDIEVRSPRGYFPVPQRAEYAVHSVGIYGSDGRAYVLLLGVNPTHREKLDAELRLGYQPEVLSFIRERDLHLKLYEILGDYPIILSYNGDNFDLPYLLNRGRKLGIEPPIYFGHYRGKKFIEYQVRNTIHIDLYQFFKKNAVRLYAYSGAYQTLSLDAVSEALLGAKKIEHELWFDEMSKQDLIVYNITDVKLTMELTTYNDNLTMRLMIMLMRVGRMTISFVNRESISKWILNWIAYEHERRGLLLPRKSDIERYKGGFRSDATIEGKQYRGAIVFEPESGIYWDVVVADFASLYPSVIKKYNLSYETILCDHRSCRSNRVTDLPHWVCRKKVGIMSSLVGFVRDVRVRWYKKNRDAFSKTVQAALKVFINASYGVFGASSFDLFCPPVAESTTAYSREALLAARDETERMGLEVIYGDTDSIFIHRISDEQFNRLRIWSVVKLGIELGIDYRFRFLVMSGRKKNYFGITTDDRLIIKGLTVKKRNTAQYIQDTFTIIAELLKKVKQPEDMQLAIAEMKSVIRTRVEDLKEGRVAVEELTRIVSLNKPFDEYSVSTPAVQVAVQLMRDSDDIKQGSQFHIVAVNPFKSLIRTQRFKHLRQGTSLTCKNKEVNAALPHEIDYGKYVNNMRKAFDPILSAFSMTWNDIFQSTLAIDDYF